MKSMELLILAVKNVLRAGTRTTLCVIAIAIGITAVSSITSLGSAAGESIRHEISRTGVRGIAFYTKTGEAFTERSMQTFKNAADISAYMPLVMAAGNASLRNQTLSVGTLGIDENLSKVFDLTLLYGQLPTRAQIVTKSPVVVIDETLAKHCYGRENIVGKTLWLSLNGVTRKMEICAVIRSQSAGIASLFSTNIPYLVYLPYTTLTDTSPELLVNKVIVRTKREDVESFSDELIDQLRRSTNMNFDFEDMDRYVETFGSITDIVTLLVGCIAAISVLVGGIGVANAMISSVESRTKEIGIYRALGAKRCEIVQSFLWESIILCVMGGLVGIAVNLILVYILKTWMTITLQTQLFGISLSLFTALFCGVCVGWMPAVRAANLDPIEAIRQE